MAAPAVPTPALSIPTRPWLRYGLRAGMVLAGLVLGLVVAELVFRYRDAGAFPHLNVYVADPELGVRLMPGATQKLAFGGNPVTRIRINDDGFRGADLPAPSKDEVLVVGDSQVFGLGVEEDETFSAKLAAATRRTVVNAGVPTYGPGEYAAMVKEQLAKRHSGTVVLTINLVNDLFEDKHPNKDRHVVWDGWAVRKETAPDSTTWFPGRDFVYRRSHLFFALRRWWHSGDAVDERGVASEGTWRDLVSTGERVGAERRAADAKIKEHGQQLAKVQGELASSEDALDQLIQQIVGQSNDYDEQVLPTARANPGDIVYIGTPYAEESRATVVTADQIRTAAIARAKLRKEIERWAKGHTGKDAQAAAAKLSARDQLFARLSELDAQKLQAALDPPLAGTIRSFKQLVESNGARLVVLILPIDVQVSAQEWAKYGHDPIDMTPTAALTGELVELCRGLGVSALDASAALAAAEPGAFLDKDIHMTPRGHAAVAAALAKTLAEPPPARVTSALSPVPVPAIWHQAPEVIVAGSTAAGCETKVVREWLRVLCARTDQKGPPFQVHVDRDDTGEAMVLVIPQGVSLLVPIVAGKDYAARITWPDVQRVLRVTWPAGATRPAMAFDKPEPIKTKAPDTFTFPSQVEHDICDCWNGVYGGERYYGRDLFFTCSGAYGATDARCTAKYPAPLDGDAKHAALSLTPEQRATCEQMLACIRRDPASPP